MVSTFFSSSLYLEISSRQTAERNPQPYRFCSYQWKVWFDHQENFHISGNRCAFLPCTTGGRFKYRPIKGTKFNPKLQDSIIKSEVRNRIKKQIQTTITPTKNWRRRFKAVMRKNNISHNKYCTKYIRIKVKRQKAKVNNR